MAEHGDEGFLEKVFFIGVGSFQPGRLGAGIDGHSLFNGMGQVDDRHGRGLLFFFYDNTGRRICKRKPVRAVLCREKVYQFAETEESFACIICNN